METMIQETAASVNWKLEGNFVLNNDLREEAIAIIGATPFPTSRTEAWKYTRLNKVKNGEFAIQKSINSESTAGLTPDSLKMVFVNGHFDSAQSSKQFPDGIKVLALSEMDAIERNYLGNIPLENELFHAFNTAYATDGVYIHVSAKMVIEPVIELIFIQSGEHVLSTVRNVITTEAFSAVKLVKHFTGNSQSSGFTNCITEINVGKNSQLTIDKLQEESTAQYHIATEWVNQAADSQFTINTVTLSGALVRNNLTIAVNGTNCETNLNGAYIIKGNQHVDNHTIVDHKVANCLSNELYKGVITEKGTAVFNGKVFVRKDAQKINAFQSNANVLLGQDATMNSKPELEIYADDVKCSHGSTTGQLDEEAVFYLRARGLSEESARQLMVGAFIEDVLSKIENESVLNRIHENLHQNFGWSIQ